MLIKIKFAFPEIFFGILLAVAIFAMGMVFESSRHQPAEKIPAQNTANQDQAKNIDGGIWNWLTHDSTGVFTLFLVIVGAIQIGVFLRQLRLIGETLGPAKEAADAAKLNAEALMSGERAHLFIGFDGQAAQNIIVNASMLGDDQSDGKIGRPAVYFHFRNHGKTRAILTSLYKNFRTVPPDANALSYVHQDFPLGSVVDGGAATAGESCQIETELTVADAKAIAQGKLKLWFYGYVGFTDIFGRYFEWSWRHEYAGDGWRLVNYEEKLIPKK